MPPAEGMYFAVWPIETAARVQPISAMKTASGSVVPVKLIPMPIADTRPTPGAM
jgi:hypothetical protein